MEIPTRSALKHKLQWIKTLFPKFELTSGTLTAVAVSVILFITSKCFNVSFEVFSLGTSVVVNGHVHKLFTYPFFHKDANQLLLSVIVLVAFCSSLERSVGTVRFTYLLLLLSACTGLMHSLLELLLFLATERSHVQGFIPGSLALLGMVTVHSRMRRAVLLGVSVPTVTLPWFLLLATLLIPDTIFLCNAIAILVGEMYGVGCFSLLDLSEARASVLDKKIPFRLLKMLATGLYVPASIEERRRTLHQLCRPAPGSYPVQAYAPALSVTSAQGADASPHMYEGWQHSTYTQGSFAPASFSHGHSQCQSHGHSHGQMMSHQTSDSWPQGAPFAQALSGPLSYYPAQAGGYHPAPTPPSGIPTSLPVPSLTPVMVHFGDSPASL